MAQSLPDIKEEPKDFQNQYLDSVNMPLVKMSVLPGQSVLPATQSITSQTICDSLQLPDIILQLPTFDGSPDDLHDFIENVEEVLDFVKGTDNTPYGALLLRTIRNKVVGDASRVLRSEETPIIWDDIKQCLLAKFSDTRSADDLFRTLFMANQGNKSVRKFYEEIFELQKAINNNIVIHEENREVRKAKKELYLSAGLKAFLRGLKDPLGVIVRSMRPDTLTKAFEYCRQEQKIYFEKKKATDRCSPYYNSGLGYNNWLRNKGNYTNRNFNQKRRNNYGQYNQQSNSKDNFNSLISSQQQLAIVPPKKERPDSRTADVTNRRGNDRKSNWNIVN